jgi:hypothetical protein
LFTPPGEGLYFDEPSHRYWLDGVELPSVTQVLAIAGLTDWSHCGEWARERGSVVHKAIHLELTGGLDWSTLPESLHPYVSAELQAIQDLGAEVVASEVRIVSKLYGYAGTLDRVVRINGRLVLWDTKTGPIVPAYGLQTAAYVEAIHEMQPDFLGGQRIERRYALRLNADGTYELLPFTDRQDIVNFHAAVRVANWKRQKGLAA